MLQLHIVKHLLNDNTIAHLKIISSKLKDFSLVRISSLHSFALHTFKSKKTYLTFEYLIAHHFRCKNNLLKALINFEYHHKKDENYNGKHKLNCFKFNNNN